MVKVNFQVSIKEGGIIFGIRKTGYLSRKI